MQKNYKLVHIIHIMLYSPITTENKPVSIFGRTRLMKMLFIFEKELFKKFTNPENITKFDFESYNFGPFSKKVYEALDFLESRDIIKIENVPESSLNYEDALIDQAIQSSEEENIFFQENETFYSERFLLTNKGIQIMRDSKKLFSWVNLNEEQKNLLINFKTQMVGTPLRKILKYVYKRYPKYAEFSKIIDRIGL